MSDYTKLACTKFAAELMDNIMKARNGGNLGSLGPCVFEAAEPFFRREISNESKAPEFFFQYATCYAIGDIHADLIVLLSLLKELGIIDENANFAQEYTLVVFVGDLLDGSGRCESQELNNREEVDILQYLHALRLQARKRNSHVVTTLGNHEVARALGTLSEYDKYIGNQVIGWTSEHAILNMEGRLAQTKHFFRSVMNKYIARHFPLFVLNNDVAFMHSGFSGSVFNLYEKLDRQTRNADFMDMGFATYDYLRGDGRPVLESTFNSIIFAWLTSREPMNPKAPDSAAGEAKCAEKVEVMKRIFGVKYFVFGHSVQHEFANWCNQSVFRIDFGMSRAFCNSDGRYRALHIIKLKDATRINLFELESNPKVCQVTTTKVL